MASACLCAIILLYILEWLYALHNKQPYNLLFKLCTKKLFWRIINSV